MATAVWSYITNRLCGKPNVLAPARADQSEKENWTPTFSAILTAKGAADLRRKILAPVIGGRNGIYAGENANLYRCKQTRTVLSATLLSVYDNSVTRYIRTLDISHNLKSPKGGKSHKGAENVNEIKETALVPAPRKYEKNATEKSRVMAEKKVTRLQRRAHDVESLTGKYLKHIYQPYDSVRKQLVRQTRDLLLCRYMGNHREFLERFLKPASALLLRFKRKVKDWPLCYDNLVLVQLGEIDSQCLNPGDFYISVHDTNEGVRLSAYYKTGQHVGRISINEPQFEMDWLSDQQLTSVLRRLVVSLERGIDRMQWHPTERPWKCAHSDQCADTNDHNPEEEGKERELIAPLARPEEFNLEADLSPSNVDVNGHPWTEDVTDDGYCDGPESPTNSLSSIDQDLLHSRIALLPGCRDAAGRSVVVISCSKLKQFHQADSLQLAQLLTYYHGIPRREDVANGFLVLVDAREAVDAHWTLLDDAFAILETNVPNSINSVVVWKGCLKNANLFPSSGVKFEVVNKEVQLEKYMKKDQLLPELGGSYTYDHFEWIGFFKFFEPFMNGCRFSGHYLVTMMQELGMTLCPSSLNGRMIDQQKNNINQTFQDEQLRHLEEEGDTILAELESYRKRSPQNVDYSHSLEKISVLYQEIRKAMGKFSKLADRRLHKLEEYLRCRSFHEESSQVLTWLCRSGEESLIRYQTIVDSLMTAREQGEEFDKFYFHAMRQIERGNDLLEDSIVMSKGTPTSKWKDSGGVGAVAVSLRRHLDSFSERLEDIRERFEENAKCYHLLDKCYEWALETMKYVSSMKLDSLSSPENLEKLINSLQKYMEAHPPVSEETFEGMISIAKHLDNSRLLEQCKTAQSRCQVTTDLVKTRQAMLVKARQHLEQETVSHPKVVDDSACKFREKSHSPNSWNSQMSTSPIQPLPGSHMYLQRHSIATASPFGLYLPFSSSFYPDIKQDAELNWYFSQKGEQFINQGLITDDLTTQGPVASIPTSVLEARVGVISNGIKCNKFIEDQANNNTYEHSHYRPIKKYMRRNQTWQLCEEALDKVTKEVQVQNEKLQMERSSVESSKVTSSTPRKGENGDPLSHCHSSPVFSPVPVNSHLTRPTSLEISEITSNDDSLKSKKTVMLIMREMIQTERDYVKSLQFIIENYIPELLREDIPQALRGQRNTVFGNIEKIYEFHSQFFMHELEMCENLPFCAGQCFLKYESQFYLYALYNKNKPKSDSLISEYGSHFFRQKQLEIGDKMDLASYLLKPVQRMGKYALLLKQLLKECPERDTEHMDLKAAEEMVRFQLRHGNDLLAMDALRECDVNVKEQGRLLRQEEFLVWQGRSRKTFRHVFLFEDLILFSKSRRDPERKSFDLYQYKNSIKTTDIGLTEQVGESQTKFEIWFRKRKAQDTYVLQAPNAETRNAWVQEISKLLWKQALKNREMRLAEMSSMGIGNKPCLDIRPNEDQINDRFVNLNPLNRGSYFRNSIAVTSFDHFRNNKRPHSIISISSSSSGSSQSSFSLCTNLSLGGESTDSNHSRYRSLTQQSQCSAESGFFTDNSLLEGPLDGEQPVCIHASKQERSDSLTAHDPASSNIPTPSFLLSLGEDAEESVTTPM